MAVERRLRVAAVGDNCLDVYTGLDKSFVGGNAVNVAVRWALLAFESHYFGAVGDDAAGRQVRCALERAGVDASAVQVVAGDTGLTRIELRPGGERVLAYEDFGTSGRYFPTAAEVAALAGFDWVHCVTLSNFRASTSVLADRGTRLSYDFSTRHEVERLEGIEVAFYSSQKAPAEAEGLARRALRGGAKVAVVTCGARGSVACDATNTVRSSAGRATVVDTCGAGDAYVAAFIAQRLAGADLAECVEGATELASEACEALGGFPQEPCDSEAAVA